MVAYVWHFQRLTSRFSKILKVVYFFRLTANDERKSIKVFLLQAQLQARICRQVWQRWITLLDWDHLRLLILFSAAICVVISCLQGIKKRGYTYESIKKCMLIEHAFLCFNLN
jgi:hypothetical protein